MSVTEPTSSTSSAPVAPGAELVSPLHEAAMEVRSVALDVRSAELRRRLSVVADDLDAMSYTADVRDQLDQLAAEVRTLATAQGALGAILGGAAGHLASLRADVDAVKQLGLRRYLRESRKAQKGA